MKLKWLWLAAALLTAQGFGIRLAGQERVDSKTAGSPSSIQQQIDDLRQNQERILQELAEIKQLLQTGSKASDVPAHTATTTTITLDVAGELFRGEGRARAAIMEYSDFDCSYCAKYEREVFPRLESEFLKTGKIRYYFRDLPAPGHTNSIAKARLARCAGEQGRFWEMHDLLFADPALLSDEHLDAAADGLGLNPAELRDCLKSGRYTENIEQSVAGAKTMHLRGTPAFLIGRLSTDGTVLKVSKVLIGGENYETIKSAIEEVLLAEPRSTQ